jgi:hypothetical protein
MSELELSLLNRDPCLKIFFIPVIRLLLGNSPGKPIFQTSMLQWYSLLLFRRTRIPQHRHYEEYALYFSKSIYETHKAVFHGAEHDIKGELNARHSCLMQKGYKALLQGYPTFLRQIFYDWGTMLQAGRSRVWDPIRWINFFNVPNPSSL